MKSGLEFFILKFSEPFQSCCCPVQKNLPRKAELTRQVSSYLSQKWSFQELRVQSTYKLRSRQCELFSNSHLINLFTISRANETFESMQKIKSSEIAQLQAMLRKTEMRVNQQERIVEQKTQENIELTNICDELISKVGK